MLGRTA